VFKYKVVSHKQTYSYYKNINAWNEIKVIGLISSCHFAWINKKRLDLVRCTAALSLSLFLLPNILFAMNQKTQEALERALEKSKSGDWRSAAKQYKAAVLYADSHIVKANALKKEAEAYQNAELYYKEFKCLKTLVENAPEQINFRKTVEREYHIANLYYGGYRERPYTWMPWIKNDNHAIEIYKAIQKQSPYAKFIPQLLIRLGSLYLTEGKNKEAEETYKTILEEHSDSDTAKIAYLDLAHLYLGLAERGDGDGYNATAAKSVLEEFMKKYPNAPEIPWAKNALTHTYEIKAERIFKLAKYYNDKGDTKVTKRYIRDILVNYPETKFVAKAEKMLNSIDMPLYSDPAAKKTQQTEKEEISKYQTKSLPGITKENLIIPANSEKKWMRPIVKETLEQDKILKFEYENKI
jgi:outer membrane protein assembly factor BamD (BamD/ComL family)